MLRYFPASDVICVHSKRDYFIAAFTFFCVAVSLVIDAHANLIIQNLLGVIAWIFLIGLLVGENKEIRIQVVIAVAFATAGEHFASVYMGGYTYRFENVPLYVPPGHGMVYLTAVALARSGFFLRYARKIAVFVVVVCGVWSLWGISGISEQGDQVGAILFCVFLIYLFKGRSPMVYLAAFFITTWLELIGTAAGTWYWAKLEPIFNLSQGNPPSGVAAWYCLVDAAAMGGAPIVLNIMNKFSEWLKTDKSKRSIQQEIE
ncbi:hypothetical protein [Nitrosomonas sp. Nm132]|jgi:hypothetical protein|uniref:hypothetical protein n=1 Tax=Nitrosomonas sp. Nm132 TaxID=1881053 RepID=UPI00087F24A7|nr:hypothetical protein [Nitrosomonas sp. Nm132]SDH71423.1 hypothetical protein SAMN05428952_10262 [Nitrosomonas sp. Nm132]